MKTWAGGGAIAGSPPSGSPRSLKYKTIEAEYE
jgi:hypothetical protein